MLDDGGLRILELAGKGYCCSQVMIQLALDEMGRENPDLIRAASGLCMGFGDCSGPCGVYLGAAAVLGLYTGKGTDMEEADHKLPLMQETLHDWFTEATAQYGGIACRDILGGDCGQPDQVKCGGLLSAASEQVRRILLNNGVDPAEGREEG